jgi:hypothetical protein
MADNRRITAKRIVLGVTLVLALIIGLIFLDVMPIGYKHVTIPQDIAFSGTTEAQHIPKITCPDPSASRYAKFNWHVPAERDQYNQPVFSSICPTYSFHELLYW